MSVKIAFLDGPWSWVCWLCSKCRRSLPAPWEVKQTKEPPHPLPCDRCTNQPKETE